MKVLDEHNRFRVIGTLGTYCVVAHPGGEMIMQVAPGEDLQLDDWVELGTDGLAWKVKPPAAVEEDKCPGCGAVIGEDHGGFCPANDQEEDEPSPDLCQHATRQPVIIEGKRVESISEDIMESYSSIVAEPDAKMVIKWGHDMAWKAFDFVVDESQSDDGHLPDPMVAEQAYLRTKVAYGLHEYPVCNQTGERVDVVAAVDGETQMVTAYFECSHCKEKAK